MNKVIESLKNHRSNRSFKKEYRLPKEELADILECARQAPSWMNGQHYSIIVVEDQEKKEKIFELTGQKQIATSAVFLLFCGNLSHVKVAAEIERKEIDFTDGYEAVVTATTDASLAMQNTIIAAESLGYGTVCCGGIRGVAKEVEEMFDIPKGAFVFCGLSIGKLDLELTTERVKPRLPFEANVGFDKFPVTTKEQLLEYNATMEKFAEARETKVWTDKMVSFHAAKPLEKALVDSLERQGYISKK